MQSSPDAYENGNEQLEIVSEIPDRSLTVGERGPFPLLLRCLRFRDVGLRIQRELPHSSEKKEKRETSVCSSSLFLCILRPGLPALRALAQLSSPFVRRLRTERAGEKKSQNQFEMRASSRRITYPGGTA